MNLTDFKAKWQNEINKGIISISNNEQEIIADRFIDGQFLCDRNTLNKIQADVRKLGYERYSIGMYSKAPAISLFNFACKSNPELKSSISQTKYDGAHAPQKQMKRKVIAIFKGTDVCSMHLSDLAAEKALSSLGEGYTSEENEIEVDDEMYNDLQNYDALFFDNNISRNDILDICTFGFRVAHKSFSDKEWVRWDSELGYFIAEDDVNMGTEESEFWTIRTGGNWDKGWRIWHE